MAQSAYIPTEPHQIGATLARLFADLQEEGSNYSQSATANLIVPVSRATQLDELEPLLDSFALMHPARIFVVVIDESQSTLQAEVSARCHGLTKQEHVCSEIIRIRGSAAALESAPSVLRANLLTGATTEILVWDASVPRQELTRFSQLADSMLLDSAAFAGRFSEMAELAQCTKQLIDFTWVGLGGWRDECKQMFARSGALSCMLQLKSLQIEAAPMDSGTSATALLFAGWVIDRLHLVLEKEKTGRIFGRGPGGILCEFTFASASPEDVDMLRCVTFNFGFGSEIKKAVLRRTSRLEVSADLGVGYAASRPLEDPSLQGRMRRQFLIGESFANYAAALRNALRLQQLGFCE
jgi:glucose-6-phosphate dehydrogenase assembly protein OpcA